MIDYEVGFWECFRNWGWEVGLMESWGSWFLWLEVTALHVAERGNLLGGAGGWRGGVPNHCLNCTFNKCNNS